MLIGQVLFSDLRKPTKPRHLWNPYKKEKRLDFFYLLSKMFTPTEAIAFPIAATSDISTLVSGAAADGKKLVVTDLTINDELVSLKLVGYLTTNAIQVDSKYGSHTIGFAFDEESDLAAFTALYKFFDDNILGADWKVVDMIRNKRIYLKLKVKNNQYVTRSNIKLTPKTALDAPLTRNQKVEVQVDLKAYYSLGEEKSCGFYFDIFNILFDTK